MRRIVFKSVEIVNHAQDAARDAKYWTPHHWVTTTTYDIGGARTHVMYMTTRKRLSSPFTWGFSTIVGMIFGGIILAVRAISGTVTLFWELLSFSTGLGIAYLLCTVVDPVPQPYMFEVARKDRGWPEKKRFVVVLEKNWPRFLASFQKKPRVPVGHEPGLWPVRDLSRKVSILDLDAGADKKQKT
jgi:hypothetical protein